MRIRVVTGAVSLVGVALLCTTLAFPNWLSPEGGAQPQAAGLCQGGFPVDPSATIAMANGPTTTVVAYEPTIDNAQFINIGGQRIFIDRSVRGASFTIFDSRIADGKWTRPDKINP